MDCWAQSIRDLVNLRGSRRSEDESNAVEQEGGRKGAEKEILDGGFRTPARLLAITGENVCGYRGDLERDEDRKQFDRAGHQAHADGAEDNKRGILTLMMAVFGKRIERQQKRYKHDPANEHMEEDGEGTGLNGPIEPCSSRNGKLPEARPKCDRRTP